MWITECYCVVIPGIKPDRGYVEKCGGSVVNLEKVCPIKNVSLFPRGAQIRGRLE
jgi:hypothetical protein